MADYNRAYSEPPKLYPSTLEGHPKILPGGIFPPASRPSIPEAPGRPSPGSSLPSWIGQSSVPPPAFPGIPGLPRSSGGPTFSQVGVGGGAGAGGYSPFTPSPPVQHFATGPTLGTDIGAFKMSMASSLDPTSTIAQELYSSPYNNHKERERCPSCLSISTYPVTNDGGSIMGCTKCLKTFSSPESLCR